jgi:hypothetical protein
MYSKKEKGDIGLAKTISDLTEKNIHVCLPISEHLKYDLVAEKDGICKRIQVRFTTAKNGILSVKLKSAWSNKKGNHILKREVGDFDILAIYCPQTNNVSYLEDKSFDNKTQVNIMIRESKKGLVRLEKDFLDCRNFFRLEDCLSGL